MPGNETYQQHIFNIIASMTGSENLVTIPKLFIKACGGLECGTFLAQLLYWSDKGTREDGYIYKTYDEWYEEIGLSKYSINKARTFLEGLGILHTVVKKANGNPTVHYKLAVEALIDWLVKFQQNQSKKTEKPNAEIPLSLTEITTEITNKELEPLSQKSPSGAFQVVVLTKDAQRFWEEYQSRYETLTKERHPPLTIDAADQLNHLLDTGEIYDEDTDKYLLADIDNVYSMLDEYFGHNYKLNNGDYADHRIWHFLAPGVMKNLAYHLRL